MVEKFLLVALAVKFGDAEARRKLKGCASKKTALTKKPVIIVAGGCDKSVEFKMRKYKKILFDAFSDFEGTIISGGTTAGISKIAGNIGENNDKIHTIGYVPETLPAGTELEKSYKEIRKTKGNNFTYLEPIQNWVDIVCSGIEPKDVKLIGINGGDIAAVEFRLTLSLGASVALVSGSGREAGKLLPDDYWRDHGKLIPMPEDMITLREFINYKRTKISSNVREFVAQKIHEKYRISKLESGLATDPTLAVWDKLDESFKESNRLQADHIFEKLHQIGCSWRYISGKKKSKFAFTEKEIEYLAELEHARFIVERSLEGYRYGTVKDISLKTNLTLIPWDYLGDEIKEFDRNAVKKIPEYLAEMGLEIVRNK